MRRGMNRMIPFLPLPRSPIGPQFGLALIETVGRTDRATHRWYLAPLKWHYLALFGTVSGGPYLRKPNKQTS